jgi:hypothetical protein
MLTNNAMFIRIYYRALTGGASPCEPAPIPAVKELLMSGKLLAAAISAAALAAAPAYAAPTKSNGNGSDISRLVQAITSQTLEFAENTCKQYTPGLLRAACEVDSHFPPGHCNERGKGHDIGKGKGHDKDDDCPVSS